VIQQALLTVDDAERAATLAKATEMAIESIAIIPIHYQVNAWAASSGITYAARTDEWTMAPYVKKAK